MNTGVDTERPAFRLLSGDVIGRCCYVDRDRFAVEEGLDGDAIRDLAETEHGRAWPHCDRCSEPLEDW